MIRGGEWSLLAVMLLVMMPAVSGFGISPATYEATGAGDRTYDLRIINDAREDIALRVVADGDVARMLEPTRTEVRLTPGTSEVIIPVRIAVPSGTLPGTYTGGLIVEQDPSTVTNDGFIRAIPAVRQRVSVRIPAEGKHLSARVLTSAGIAKEPLDITVALSSVGTLAIGAASTRVEVRGPTGTVLETLSSPGIPLGVGAKENVVFRWTPPSTGTYSARSVTTFDGLSTIAERSFSVGSLELDISAPVFGPFSLGDIARIEFPVRSSWNERIPGAFARVRVSQDGAVVDDFTTLSSEVPPAGDAVLVGYWNTAGRSPGAYVLDVEVFYGGSSTREQFPVSVGVDSAAVSGDSSWQEWFFVFAGILVLLLGVWLLAKRLIRKRG